MSKSIGNYIAFTENPFEMYGKIMSVPDNLIEKYFYLLTDLGAKQVKKILGLGPRNAKAKLAKEIVSVYHSQKSAEKAEKEFNRVFQKKEKPLEIPVYRLKAGICGILDLLIQTKLTPSKAEARRLVEQGAVKIDGKIINDWRAEILIKDKIIIQAGKRKFIQIKKIS